jgi:RNA polymerase sigma-70 factor (ECF subfamily)
VPADLGRRLTELVGEARGAWPDLPVDARGFVAHLAGHLPEDEGDLSRALASVHAADLYLAHACALGLPGAAEALDRAYLPQVAVFLRHVDPSPAFADEVRQLLRTHLLVAEGGAAPKIAGYSGRGRLESWLGVAAQRLGISLRRSEGARARAGEQAASFALSFGADPELDYLRARYRTEFTEAFQAAVASLDDRDRIILRLHLVSGLSHDKIGALYGVNQSTATRWIARARDTIAAETQRTLRERLRLTGTELESLVHLVGVELDVSIARCFGTS